MGVFCPDLRTAPGPGDRSGTAPLPRPQNRGPAVGARNTVKHGAVCWEPVRTKRPLPGETPSPGASPGEGVSPGRGRLVLTALRAVRSQVR